MIKMNLIEFLQKRWKVSTKKYLKINLYRRKNSTQNISRYIYQTFSLNNKSPTDSKEKLAQTNQESLKRNLYQIKFNRNLYHKTFENSISTTIIKREISTKYKIPNKKSLPNKISLVEVSFEIVLVEISPQNVW